MTAKTIWIPAMLGLATLLAPLPVLAQGTAAGRVQDAIEITDRRIAIADRLVTDGASIQAESELALAKDVQSRAREMFGSAQYAMAERTTLEARTHADRAIAIVRGLPDPDRVQVQVERTAELAERARDRLADCKENRARALLRVGLEMQARAETAIGESRYLAALQLTIRARESLFKAMRLCHVTEDVSETAARAIQRTELVLTRAREALEDHGSPPARQALQQALSLQAEARSEFRAAHYEAALRLTHMARIRAQRALRQGAPPRPAGPHGRR